MKLTLSTLAAVLMAGSLQAATLDFVAEAAGNERGVEDGTIINFEGHDVEFSATDGFAYFDDLSGGLPAGLGVCGELTDSDQCTPSSDDNITTGETVTLDFFDTYTISGLIFYDASHVSLNTNIVDTLLIAINGGDAMQYTFAEAASAVFYDVASMMFGFDEGEETANQFYVGGAVATVPLPAAGWLLIGGLGGLAAMKRRKKA